MTIEVTEEKLRTLHLTGMAKALARQRETASMQVLAFEDRLAMLVDCECQERETRRLARLVKAAKLKYESACIEAIDYRSNREIDRQQLDSLSRCDWITQGQNLILTGPSGTGKSWLACAFAIQAMRAGMTAQYWRLSNLLDELDVARADGRLLRLRSQLKKVDYLILDDWGLAPMRAGSRQELLTLIDDRAEAKATVITAQLPVDDWYEYIGEPTIADAIMDRLVHSSHRIALKGDSLRKRGNKS